MARSPARRRRGERGRPPCFGCAPAYALSRYALWHVKAGFVPEPEVTGERPAWGLRLEAAIAGGAAEIHGLAIEPGAWVRTRGPSSRGMAATTDFHVEDGAPLGHPGPGVMEVKNADWLSHRRGWTDAEPPPHVLLQLQHQLACTGMGWGVVVALIGGNRLAEPYAYARRPRLIAEIERRVADFWASIRAGRAARARRHGGRLGRPARPIPVRESWPAARPGRPGRAGLVRRLPRRRRAAAGGGGGRGRRQGAAAGAAAGCPSCALCWLRIEAPAVAGVPDRAAVEGEIVKGRCGYRRLQVREEP